MFIEIYIEEFGSDIKKEEAAETTSWLIRLYQSIFGDPLDYKNNNK